MTRLIQRLIASAVLSIGMVAATMLADNTALVIQR